LTPDAVQRGLVGEILTRLERKGFRIAGMKLIQVTPEQAAQHYAVHKERPFYDRLVAYIQSSPVVALVLDAPAAVVQLRLCVGATRPNEADPGSIRGDFGVDISNNLIHASDSPDNAEYELAVYFDTDELINYQRTGDCWLVGE